MVEVVEVAEVVVGAEVQALILRLRAVVPRAVIRPLREVEEAEVELPELAEVAQVAGAAALGQSPVTSRDQAEVASGAIAPAPA